MQQEQSNSKDEQFLLVKLSVNDLTAIGHALFPYAQFVHRIIPPSQERGRILMVIEHLRRRIASFQSSYTDDTEEQFPITEEELRVIDAALGTFLEGVHRLIPQSRQRDETIQACYNLRQYLVTALSAGNSE
ncbi:MAG TPA: hypothetical protein VHV10_21815 [Ktedonobacteraceae bacterium]|nr:hypothetical protein [Ktedonobacteraceae bacterium]